MLAIIERGADAVGTNVDDFPAAALIIAPGFHTKIQFGRGLVGAVDKGADHGFILAAIVHRSEVYPRGGGIITAQMAAEAAAPLEYG
jgi:hypothetical protein